MMILKVIQLYDWYGQNGIAMWRQFIMMNTKTLPEAGRVFVLQRWL